MVNAIKSGLGTLKKYIGQAATWLGEKLGLKSLQAWGTKVSSKLDDMVGEMNAASAGKNLTSTVSSAKGSVKTLTAVEKTEYDKLLTAWKEQQKSAGKSLNPGQGTREKLMQQAKANASNQNVTNQPAFRDKMKDIWKSTPVTRKQIAVNVANTFVFSAALCTALGMSPNCSLKAQEKIESGELTQADIEKANQQVNAEMSKAIEDAGGVDQMMTSID